MEIWMDLMKRKEREGALMQSGMGYCQSGLINAFVSIKQDIQVQGARAPVLP
jgi:hypothetical protein